MCFEVTSRPPQPPVTGHLAHSDRLSLTAADGNRLVACEAITEDAGAPGVVLIPDVRGLHPYYEALAQLFAGAGVNAIAIDFYCRTAGAEYRDEEFDFGPHRSAATDQGVRADVRAAISHLEEAGIRQIFVLGFCFGGRAAFMQASQSGIAGVVGFYGVPTRGEKGETPVDEARAGLVQAPVLALYGGADQAITPADRDAYDAALASAGVEHESVVYPGAPHSFFDRAMAEHAEACADAWERVLRFMSVASR